MLANLIWAIVKSGLTAWQFAGRIDMDASKLSRKIRGREEFTPAERERIVRAFAALGYKYTPAFLFEEPDPTRFEPSVSRKAAVV